MVVLLLKKGVPPMNAWTKEDVLLVLWELEGGGGRGEGGGGGTEESGICPLGRGEEGERQEEEDGEEGVGEHFKRWMIELRCVYEERRYVWYAEITMKRSELDVR
jgi:hypothetical protein